MAKSSARSARSRTQSRDGAVETVPRLDVSDAPTKNGKSKTAPDAPPTATAQPADKKNKKETQKSKGQIHVLKEYPTFRAKLDSYRTTLVSVMSRVHQQELSCEKGLKLMNNPMREIFETIYVFDANYAVEFIEEISNFVLNDLLLALVYLGKASAMDSVQSVKPLIGFIYEFSMWYDGCIENISDGKDPLQNDGSRRRKVAKTPKLVLELWANLLRLSTAKDRKLRLAFCTITFHWVNTAITAEISISEQLYHNHVDVFLQLLGDPNKDIRIRCMQLLEHFQNDYVRGEVLARLHDPAAHVRSVAVSCAEISDEVESSDSTLRLIIARIGDVAPEVRMGVYKKLSELYNGIPVEMVLQILGFGLAERAVQVKRSFLGMLSGWIDACGGLLTLIADIMSQAEDLTLLESAIMYYLTEAGIFAKFGNTDKSSRRKGVQVTEGLDGFYVLMDRFMTLTPSEVFIVMIFLQANNKNAVYTNEINMIHVLSYLQFLLELHQKRRLGTDELPEGLRSKQPAYTVGDEDGFADAMEVDESALLKYGQEESEQLGQMYQGECLPIHGLRMLLVIAHYHSLDDSYHFSLVESTCEKVLLYGPVRQSVAMLMSYAVIQTSLGTNAPSFQMPSRWLKPGFVFAATSLLRCIYARKYKSEGRFFGSEGALQNSNYEITITSKILSIISDIKDPFQLSGTSNLSIRREEFEQMEMTKLRQFDASGYSIEHLNMFDAKLSQQIEQVEMQLKELESVANIATGANANGNANTSATSSNLDTQLLDEQHATLNGLRDKIQFFCNVIRDELRDRWTRILAIVEAFLGQTRSRCEDDVGLAGFPREILLPQMTFFCSKVNHWQQQTLVDQYCDVLSSKCLGTWCIINNSSSELNRQMHAFNVALKGSLAILEGSLDQFANESIDAIAQRIEVQTLRCEMYISTLADLLVTRAHVSCQQQKQQMQLNVERDRELYIQTLETIWSIVSVTNPSSLYIQSLAIRVACKLCMVELVHPGSKAELQEWNKVACQRIRGLLELAFLAPFADRTILSKFKFIKNSEHIFISPEDKICIMSTCALYPAISPRHLNIFHQVLEHLLMSSLDHAIRLEISLKGFSDAIQFMTSTILHKAPLKFGATSFAKYIKWLVLVAINSGNGFAEKIGFVALLQRLVGTLTMQNMSPLISNLAPLDFPIESARTILDACCWYDTPQTYIDTRDLKILIEHLLRGPYYVKNKPAYKALVQVAQLLQKVLESLHKYAPETATPDARVLEDLINLYDAYVASIAPRSLVSLLKPGQRGKAASARRQDRRHKRTSGDDDDDDDEDGDDDDDGNWQ